MNNYINNSEEIYAAILEEDAVYNGLRRLELPVRDGRRRQRRRKQAQQNARFNQFHNWPLNPHKPTFSCIIKESKEHQPCL